MTKPRRDIAMLFQRPALLPWRSVLDNVLLPVEVFGWKRSAHRDRVLALLEMVGLSGFEKRLPHELSGGMQQRVSLCRALMQSPKVMLMDEPFSALHALTREELAVQLQRIHIEFGGHDAVRHPFHRRSGAARRPGGSAQPTPRAGPADRRGEHPAAKIPWSQPASGGGGPVQRRTARAAAGPARLRRVRQHLPKPGSVDASVGCGR